MTEKEIQLIRTLGSAVVDREWEYFQEWARRFDEYPPERRYGILPQGAVPDEKNMIYSADVRDLQYKHLCYIRDTPTGGDIGYQLRKHIDWIEQMEGKQ
jgi:hypothetical protein